MSDKAEVTLEDAEKIDSLPEEAKADAPIDGAALEKAMIEAEARKSEDIDPVEIASMMLTLYTPRFCALIDQLSNRQLRRVIKSIVEYPVGKTYHHRDKIEAECFGIGKNLMDAKYVLVANTYNENREKILNDAAEAAGKAEIITEFTEEPQKEESSEASTETT